MEMKDLQLTEKQLRSFQYFLEQDNLTSWVEWDELVVRLTTYFPDLAWYFTYQTKTKAIKTEILLQVNSFIKGCYG